MKTKRASKLKLSITLKELQEAMAKDFHQQMIDSLTPDRGYAFPTDNVRALIAHLQVLYEQPKSMKTKQKYPAHVEFGRSKPGRGKGKWRLRTRAENGNVLMVTSEGYCNQAEMWNAVMSSVDAIQKEYKVQFPG